jgi:hypothetical protein
MSNPFRAVGARGDWPVAAPIGIYISSMNIPLMHKIQHTGIDCEYSHQRNENAALAASDYRQVFQSLH